MNIAPHIDRAVIRASFPLGSKCLHTVGERSYIVYRWWKRPGVYPIGFMALNVRADLVMVASPRIEACSHRIVFPCSFDPAEGIATVADRDVLPFVRANLQGTFRIIGGTVPMELDPEYEFYRPEPAQYVSPEYVRDHISHLSDREMRITFAFSREGDAALFAMRFGRSISKH